MKMTYFVRRNIIHRDTLVAASAIYKGWCFRFSKHEYFSVELPELHGSENGVVPATFHIIYMVLLPFIFNLPLLIHRRLAGSLLQPSQNRLNEVPAK